MVRIVLVQPGTTDFNQQGRITGTLDIPLNEQGNDEVALAIRQLSEMSISTVYSSPCQAAMQTAEAVAEAKGAKLKRLDKLQNLNQGLWQGKKIEEVKTKQPKVYRQWQENPDSVCPPEGEALGEARVRLQSVLKKLIRKHEGDVVALVMPEPLASLARNVLSQAKLGDLWKAERSCGSWELISVESASLVTSG